MIRQIDITKDDVHAYDLSELGVKATLLIDVGYPPHWLWDNGDYGQVVSIQEPNRLLIHYFDPVSTEFLEISEEVFEAIKPLIQEYLGLSVNPDVVDLPQTEEKDPIFSMEVE